jgi:hypothetical protein
MSDASQNALGIVIVPLGRPKTAVFSLRKQMVKIRIYFVHTTKARGMIFWTFY